jgi:hypothetical protein
MPANVGERSRSSTRWLFGFAVFHLASKVLRLRRPLSVGSGFFLFVASRANRNARWRAVFSRTASRLA